jgi:two-component system response regulator DevR
MNNPPISPGTGSTIRILLVDDHKMVRMGLRELLAEASDIAIVGEAATAAEALAECTRLQPDLVLLDYKLPDSDGVKTCARLKALCPAPRVLMLTSFAEKSVVSAAVNNGVDGYVLKEIDGPDLAIAIRKIQGGGAFLDPRVTRQLMDQMRARPDPLAVLSVQERRILSLVAEGKTNKEIGVELGLSDKTVRNYFTGVLNKLGVARRSEAIALFVRQTG